MIKEITKIDLNDNIKMTYLDIKLIRDEDEYGGFRIDILVEMENIREKFHIDIVTGDPITPKEIIYKYKPILSDSYINLWAYNIETVLAEKIETILSRLRQNGRMRDFYDVYLIYMTYWENVNITHLKKAIEKTFEKREYYENPKEAIELIRSSDDLKKRWSIYQNRFDYAKDIEFVDIINCLVKIVEQFEPLVV